MAIALALTWLAAAPARASGLAEALGHVQEGDYTQAYDAVAGEGALAVDLVTWLRLSRGQGGFEDYLHFMQRHPDWPGLLPIRRIGETEITPETPRADVLAFFGNRHAATPHGALHLAQALSQFSRDDEARAEIVLAWRMLTFSRSEQAIFMAEFGPLLKRHNFARLDRMLWRGQHDQAERMYPFLEPGERALARARIALRKDDKGVDALIAAVPEELADDPGLAYERFVWRLGRGRTDSAEEMLLARSDSAEALGEPRYWADARRTLARDALRAGRAKDAYRLAVGHHLTEGTEFADLEWLAGYIALTRFDDPDTALHHFRRFRAGVDDAASLGRGAYWEAKAYTALGRLDDAQVALAFAAEFQSGFYGLLAAEAAGLPMDPALVARDTPEPGRAFLDTDLMRAGLMLRTAGERRLAALFFLQLADTLDDDGIAQLAAHALALGEPYLAVTVAARAESRGLALADPTFPLAELPQTPVPPELVLSVIRRESAFHAQALSRVGASGMMQLMPATAREVAGWLGETHSADRLVEDPDYNIRLGSAYLEYLSKEFDGNLLLVAAAYNAGPGRVRSWLRTLGDPRDGTDPLDWIESIPFNETRNYVMRVAESVVIYRARLAGQTQPLRLSEELKG